MGETERLIEAKWEPVKNTPSLAGQVVCRQTPEVGAVCVNVHVRIWGGGAGKLAFLPQQILAERGWTLALSRETSS